MTQRSPRRKFSKSPARTKVVTDEPADPAADVKAAIQGLEGKDKVGTAGQALAAAGGVAAGAGAAGAVAGAVGASTFLGSATLGSLVGGVLVTTTPVGWVVGCAVAGGAAAYGIARLMRSAGRQDEVRSGIRQRLQKRLDGLRQDDAAGTESQLRAAISSAVGAGRLDTATAQRLLSLVAAGKLPLDRALARVRGLQTQTKGTGTP